MASCAHLLLVPPPSGGGWEGERVEPHHSRERAASCRHRLALLLAKINVPPANRTSWIMAECKA